MLIPECNTHGTKKQIQNHFWVTYRQLLAWLRWNGMKTADGYSYCESRCRIWNTALTGGGGLNSIVVSTPHHETHLKRAHCCLWNTWRSVRPPSPGFLRSNEFWKNCGFRRSIAFWHTCWVENHLQNRPPDKFNPANAYSGRFLFLRHQSIKLRTRQPVGSNAFPSSSRAHRSVFCTSSRCSVLDHFPSSLINILARSFTEWEPASTIDKLGLLWWRFPQVQLGKRI